MKRIRTALSLFFSMLKIGAFTFGGGYAMISFFDHEFVENKKWLDKDEFLNLVTVAESTPGPIAINCATYIGYKKAGILGSVTSTVGMVFPSLAVIYLISLFFDSFIASPVIAAAFGGIRVAVVYLIFSAGIKMLKKMKKKPLNIAIMSIAGVTMTALTLLSVKFSSVFYVIISGAIGGFIYTVTYLKRKGAEKDEVAK